MAALTVFLLMVDLLLVVSEDQKKTVKPGDNIILSCKSNDSRPVAVVEWSRTDLRSEYVLVFKDDQIDPELQHPSFQNRVDFQDRQMKHGNVSLMLKNVTINDTGTYVCKVAFSKSNRMKRSQVSTDPITTIQLQVSPPPPEHKHHGAVLAVGLVAVVGLIVVLGLVYKRKISPPRPPFGPSETETQSDLIHTRDQLNPVL